MTYLVGTLTDANAPSVLYGSIATALATEGFTLEDTVVITTVTWKIWKCAAANNAESRDWYLIVGYTTTGAGSVQFFCSEGWNVATHKAIRGVFMRNSDTGSPYQIYWIYGTEVSGSNIAWDPATGSPRGATEYAINDANLYWAAGDRAISCPATSFAYWISIKPERVIALGSGSPAEMIYNGLYHPSTEYTDLATAQAAYAGAAVPQIYPLVSARYAGPATAAETSGTPTKRFALSRIGGLITHPRYDSSAGDGVGYVAWNQVFRIWSDAGLYARIPDGVRSSGSQLDGLTNRAKAAKAYVFLDFGGALPDLKAGSLYGVYGLGATGAIARGDTLTIGGVPCVVSTPSGGYTNAFETV